MASKLMSSLAGKLKFGSTGSTHFLHNLKETLNPEVTPAKPIPKTFSSSTQEGSKCNNHHHILEPEDKQQQ
jgi:spore coat protein U-like protein